MQNIDIKNLSVHFSKSDFNKSLFDMSKFNWWSRYFSQSVETVRAVSDVTLEIKSGEIFGIVGESGCGKTTLGRSLVGLNTPQAGTIQIGTRSHREFLHEASIQMVFQDPFGSLNPRMTVLQTLEEPLVIKRTFNKKMNSEERKTAVLSILEQVGLTADVLHRYPHEFSGGQRQRIGIARALMLNPKILICDEAVAALDVSIQGQILNLLIELNKKRGLTIIFISHDVGVVRYLCDRVAVMYLGRIVETGSVQAVLDDPQHPYTKGLLASVPRIDGTADRKRPRPILDGEIPSPVNPPSGCAFHPRCGIAQQSCREAVPELQTCGTANSVRKVACPVVVR